MSVIGKWFNQAQEIERLREQNSRKARIIEELQARLAAQQTGDEAQINSYEVSPEELQLVADGKAVEAIKRYRERTGVALVTAKQAIDSVSNG